MIPILWWRSNQIPITTSRDNTICLAKEQIIYQYIIHALADPYDWDELRKYTYIHLMTMTLSLPLWFLVCVLHGVEADGSVKAPVVKTSTGEIIRTTKEVHVFGKHITVNQFFGIPYAEAPVGELRFQKPVPKKPFTSPFQATEHRKACLQLLMLSMSDAKEKVIPAGEDCLTLNVYVPAENSGSKTVMVWIHGGGFFCGASNPYIADTLAAYGDVIVVTINYRVSIWGFLSTGDTHASGNYGLWDQHLAI